MDTKSAVSGNRLIDALPAETAAALRQRLKPMMLEFGVMLGESGAPITQAVFPRTGLISVVTELSSGERIETALIGRSGVLGASAPFGGRRPHQHQLRPDDRRRYDDARLRAYRTGPGG